MAPDDSYHMSLLPNHYPQRRHFYLISTRNGSNGEAAGPSDEAKAAEAQAILDAPIGGGGAKKRGMGGMGKGAELPGNEI